MITREAKQILSNMLNEGRIKKWEFNILWDTIIPKLTREESGIPELIEPKQPTALLLRVNECIRAINGLNDRL